MSQSDYRTAVALNNMAIAMIEKACYQQALDTLKGASMAMQAVALSQESKAMQADNSSQRQQFVSQSLLDQAHRNAAIPVVADRRLTTEVVSHDAALVSVYPEIQRNPSTHLLIRIETEDSFSGFSGLSLNSAIILYNLAVAFLCQAQNETCFVTAFKHHSNAITFLQYAHSLLDSMLVEACISPLTMSSEIGISVMVLRALVRSLEGIGKIEEAVSCAREHNRLCLVANALKIFQTSTAAAPAA